MTTVTLLASRLRVEERLLQRAFSERGHEVSLLAPESLAIPLTGEGSELPRFMIDRGEATPERATIAALLGAVGGVVVNRAATTRLLADRLSLFRHLIVAAIPVPKTEIAFGEDATLAAIERVGYPAFLLSPGVDSRVPDVVVSDRDAAEAIVEHRATLGHERMVVVQEHIEGRTVRLAIVGSTVMTPEIVNEETHGAMRYEPYPESPCGLTELAERMMSRLGSGVYEVKIVEAPGGPVVVKANNLVDFRGLADAGIDVAGKIADFALSQAMGEVEARRGD